MSDENHLKPKAILVHDPAISGCLNLVDRANHLELLFSSIPKPRVAEAEHKLLRELLQNQGIKVLELFDVLSNEDKDILATNPNIIFTRDPLITLPWLPKLAIIASMREPLRQPEAEAMERCSGKLGLNDKLVLPEGLFLEGGDVIPLLINNKRILVIRSGGRSSGDAVEFLAAHTPSLCDEIVEVNCKGDVLHLDSMMGFAGSKIIVFDPSSVTNVRLHSSNQNLLLDLPEYLKLLGIELLSVTYDEADRLQATNYINLGNDTIVAYSGSERIIKQLRERGVTVLDFAGHELAKGRGGPRCLTRPIY